MTINYNYVSISVQGAVRYGTIQPAINDTGEVVDTFYDSNDFSHIFIYNAGVASILDDTTLPVVNDTFSSGVNDAGEIVGYCNDGHIHGFTYLNGISSLMPDFNSEVPLAVNNNGDIVGYDQESGVLTTAFCIARAYILYYLALPLSLQLSSSQVASTTLNKSLVMRVRTARELAAVGSSKVAHIRLSIPAPQPFIIMYG